MNEEGGGGFFKQKFMGVPAWVFLLGAAALAYWYFSRQSGTPTNSTSGGGGQVHTGKTVVQSGAVRINVRGGGANGGTGDDDEPQPKPPHGGKGDKDKHTRAITVAHSMTLEELARERNWTSETLADVEAMNIVRGKHITPETRLHKGQTIIRPLDSPV